LLKKDKGGQWVREAGTKSDCKGGSTPRFHTKPKSSLSHQAQMRTVLMLINQHSHGRIGPRIRDKPGHLLHDERIAHDQAHTLGGSVDSGFREDSTMIKPNELHQADLADAVMS
jgi:hypothetical protein